MNLPEDAEFLCIIGWDKDLYEKALSWVDETRRVAIVSDQERESVDPRVQIYVLDSPLQREGLIKKIAWSAVFKKLAVIGEGKEIETAHLAAGLILSEAADWGVTAMKNAWANRKPFRRGMELKGAFSGVPAIVVGAGPSLEKNGHLLKAFKDKALILAGGSALNVIDVEPHFAASIDAEAPHEQFKKHPFSKTPFCYQARMSAENFSLVKGERLLFPDSSSEAINWLYGEEPFDGGWTVGNFLTAAAIHFGCDPIIFVGMDLCYRQNRKYAQIDAEAPKDLVRVGDVFTQRDWLMAAKWTEAKAKNWFDTSEGILSLPKANLSDFLGFKEQNLRVQEKIQKLTEHAPSRFEEWEASLARCRESLEGEIVHEKLLLPLWQIWRPIFEREEKMHNMDLHKALFFRAVIEEHEKRIFL